MLEANHRLKCWPEFFGEILEGNKKHDLRRSSDREFSVGDKLLLEEFDPVTATYTGRRQLVTVTYITSHVMPCALSQDALGEGFCILSIARHGLVT